MASLLGGVACNNPYLDSYEHQQRVMLELAMRQQAAAQQAQLQQTQYIPNGITQQQPAPPDNPVLLLLDR